MEQQEGHASPQTLHSPRAPAGQSTHKGHQTELPCSASFAGSPKEQRSALTCSLEVPLPLGSASGRLITTTGLPRAVLVEKLLHLRSWENAVSRQGTALVSSHLNPKVPQVTPGANSERKDRPVTLAAHKGVPGGEESIGADGQP